jgi:hypothetical protein
MNLNPFAKAPKMDMGPMDQALSLINQQYQNVNQYFTTADTSFEAQYSNFYGQEMTDAINNLAGSGVFESPVSENALNRKRTALADTYATGKSSLAGQKMQALGSVDQQKISYYQNLANLQFQEGQAKANAKNQQLGMGISLVSAFI